MIKCIIIDDEPIALDIIEGYIKKVDFIELVGSFRNGIEAFSFLQNNKVNLVILDVNMPDISGVQVAKLLPSPKPIIIFCTAYAEYAVESYNVEALDYLLKPVEFNRFFKAVIKAKTHFDANLPYLQSKRATESNQNQNKQSNYIMVKSGNETQKINLNEIIYIEGTGNYITIHTNAKKIMSLQSMKDFLKFLPYDSFFRIHKSFIISFNFVESIENHQVNIKDKIIPIGLTYRNDFKHWLSLKKN